MCEMIILENIKCTGYKPSVLAQHPFMAVTYVQDNFPIDGANGQYSM